MKLEGCCCRIFYIRKIYSSSPYDNNWKNKNNTSLWIDDCLISWSPNVTPGIAIRCHPAFVWKNYSISICTVSTPYNIAIFVLLGNLIEVASLCWFGHTAHTCVCNCAHWWQSPWELNLDSPCSRALRNGALLASIHRRLRSLLVDFGLLAIDPVFANFNHIFCILLLHIPRSFDTCLWLAPSWILAITNSLSLSSILKISNKCY